MTSHIIQSYASFNKFIIQKIAVVQQNLWKKNHIFKCFITYYCRRYIENNIYENTNQ